MPRVELDEAPDGLTRAGRIRFQNGSMSFWLPEGLDHNDVEVRLVKKKGPIPCTSQNSTK